MFSTKINIPAQCLLYRLEKHRVRQVSAFIPSFLARKIAGQLTATPGFEQAPVTNRYEAIRGKLRGKTVIIYRSGSVVYDEALKEVRSILEEALYEHYRTAGTTIGSDEAGKGEALGPLVIAAVALTPRQAAYLQSIGVADSKIVPESSIHVLAKNIERVSLGHSVLIISPYRLNQMFEKKWKYGNLNDILARAHRQVLGRVVSKIAEEPARIIIDKFDSSRSGERVRLIQDAFPRLKVQAVEKGEVFPAVAAASILARSSYLKWIHRNINGEVHERVKNGDYNVLNEDRKILHCFKAYCFNRLSPKVKHAFIKA
ncbi:MAG: hypothetical protein FGF50_10930 [Candidatus Brockarchaeota archaeon]|nr:hypothetical protein [Candidatus Brockarchaeota archaeon]